MQNNCPTARAFGALNSPRAFGAPTLVPKGLLTNGLSSPISKDAKETKNDTVGGMPMTQPVSSKPRRKVPNRSLPSTHACQGECGGG